jgi:uncharacterized membrane protein (UPF0182 family)
MLIATLVIVLLFVLASITAPFWINWLWFGSMGYRSVIITNYLGVTITFLVTAILAGAAFFVNVRLAFAIHGIAPPRLRAGLAGSAWRPCGDCADRGDCTGPGDRVAEQEFLAGSVVGVARRRLRREGPHLWPRHLVYFFSLPVLHGLQVALLWIVGVITVAVVFVYLVRLGVRFGSWGDVPSNAVRHISGLISVLLLLVAAGYILNTFELVFSTRGVVIGPGFTDVNIVRPVNWLMAFLSAAIAMACCPDSCCDRRNGWSACWGGGQSWRSW